LPGRTPGDQFVVLKIVAPPADDAAREALYKEMAAKMPMNPRQAMESEQ
jgi:curved DNA-binding protein